MDDKQLLNEVVYDVQKAHYLVVTGIVVKDGKYLIAKKSEDEKAFPNQWTVPGGKLELDDYAKRPKDTSAHWYNVFEDLLKREVKEEVGLDIRNVRYLTSLSYIRSDNIPTLIVSLYADYDKGEIKLCPALTDYKWVSLEEAKNYDLIEGIYEELEMLDKVLRGEEVGEWGKRSLIIDDKVFGSKEIKEEILIDLINSRPIQRLKRINQYGVPDEYYHKKNFSRYDHSIGVFLLLKELGANLEEQIAGLIHDVSHTVFSHVIDWVLGDATSEDYQDNNHLEFLEKSEIRNILERHGFDYKKLSDIESFSLLEKEIPGLCADRIDYTLRELKEDGLGVGEFVSDLMKNQGQVVFKNKGVAEKFAMEFLRLQNEHWAGKQARTRYYILGSILKRALDEGIINMNDLYKTDEEVINKLIESSDSEIIRKLDLLRGRLNIVESLDKGVLLVKKFRYIDPEVLIEGNIRRLSEISEDFQDFLEKEREKSEVERRYVYT